MEGLDVKRANSDDEAPKSPQESRRLSILRCIQSLVHACQCRNANCSLPSCQKMKRVVRHTKVCKRKTNGGCPVCKQLIALCCYHAKQCQENKCPIPFCLNIKHKLRQKKLQHQLQQAQMMRRLRLKCRLQQLQQQRLQQQPLQHQLQQAKMMRRRRMATMQGRVMPLPSPPASSTPSTPNHPPPAMMPQGQQPPQQAQRMLVPQQPGVRPQTPQRPGNIAPNSLQDLLRTLKSPSSPQQLQQVLNILRSNPNLMAAFIKQRAVKYPQQGRMAPPLGSL